MFTSEIRQEVEKINNSAHEAFAKMGQILLVIVTNKPLAAHSGSM
jgi:hypothetical protein